MDTGEEDPCWVDVGTGNRQRLVSSRGGPLGGGLRWPMGPLILSVSEASA
jgi:hypothetical protein